MDWITDTIAIGDYLESQTQTLLVEHKIRSVLSLVRVPDALSVENLGVEAVCVIPLIDGAGNDPRWFSEAIDTLEYLVKANAPVLIHCRAGRSRSPAVVAGYLMRLHGISCDEAVCRVAEKRDIFVVQELIGLLEKLE
jgi:protein-tyrosine phosphatase